MIGGRIATKQTTGSAWHRVLAAVRQYRREVGCAPSLGEIARRTGIRRQHIGRSLRQCEREGLIVYAPGSSDPIRLVDTAANLSDEELEAALHGRGGRIVWSPAPVVGEAYPVDPRLPDDCAALLHMIDNAE